MIIFPIIGILRYACGMEKTENDKLPDDVTLFPAETLPDWRANVLQQFARYEHHRALTVVHGRTAVEAAWQTGRSLLEAKRMTRHGEWLPWLEAVKIPHSTASRFMALATHFSDISQIKRYATVAAAAAQVPRKKQARLEAAELALDDAQRSPDPERGAAQPVTGWVARLVAWLRAWLTW